MNAQFKKGTLELLVLLLINLKDTYGYEIVVSVSKIIDVKEGTIYPLLKRLTNEKYAETYLIESRDGPVRKYYKILPLGKERLKELIETWSAFSGAINKFVKENEI
jgi:PadR family transcriptional regulator PadR